MGQMLIRKLDDDTLADWRESARANGNSLEAEIRSLIERHRPVRPARAEELRALSRSIRAMTPTGVAQTPSELIVREMRNDPPDA